MNHVNACVTARHMAGFLQCNGGKLEEFEGYNCFVFFLLLFFLGVFFFIVSCVLESK